MGEILTLRRAFMIQIMSAYSEDMWSSSWDSGLDAYIRTPQAGNLWIVLAAACNGWPQGYRGEDGWDPLTAHEVASAFLMVAQ